MHYHLSPMLCALFQVTSSRCAGGLCFPCRAGGGAFHGTSNSTPGPRSHAREVAIEKALNIMTEKPRSIFCSGQRSGGQRSPKGKFCRFQHFSTNRHITREPEELQRHEEAHSIAVLTFFVNMSPDLI